MGTATVSESAFKRTRVTYPMQSLASRAMAILGCQRFVSAQFVLDLSTMTATSPFDWEILVVIMDAVWLSVLPFVFFAVRGGTGLKLMGLVCGVSVVLVNMLSNSSLVVVLVRHVCSVLAREVSDSGRMKDRSRSRNTKADSLRLCKRTQWWCSERKSHGKCSTKQR